MESDLYYRILQYLGIKEASLSFQFLVPDASEYHQLDFSWPDSLLYLLLPIMLCFMLIRTVQSHLLFDLVILSPFFDSFISCLTSLAQVPNYVFSVTCCSQYWTESHAKYGYMCILPYLIHGNLILNQSSGSYSMYWEGTTLQILLHCLLCYITTSFQESIYFGAWPVEKQTLEGGCYRRTFHW